MYSMTGYGKGDYRKDGIELTVEVKSVNNRFLDLTVKSSRIFACYEGLSAPMCARALRAGTSTCS